MLVDQWHLWWQSKCQKVTLKSDNKVFKESAYPNTNFMECEIAEMQVKWLLVSLSYQTRLN